MALNTELHISMNSKHNRNFYKRYKGKRGYRFTLVNVVIDLYNKSVLRSFMLKWSVTIHWYLQINECLQYNVLNSPCIHTS